MKIPSSRTVKTKEIDRQRVDVTQAPSTRRSPSAVAPATHAHSKQVVHEKKLISFSCMRSTKNNEEEDAVARSDKEDVVAGSMCLPLIINGVDTIVALVDQGASRSVMRRSAFDKIKKNMQTEPRLYKVNDMYVVGSTNEYIPVIGCFKANLNTVDKKLASVTMVYVVADTNEKDIVCDFVLGRSSIATSGYSCIDTKGTGALIATEGGVIDRIPCLRCRFVNDSDSKSQLMIATDGQQSQLHTMSAAHVEKLNMFTVLVNQRVHLSHAAKNKLLEHLVVNEQLYDIGDIEQAFDDSHGDMTTSDNIHVCHLMSELGKTLPNSKEEKNVISELFAAFVPDAV